MIASPTQLSLDKQINNQGRQILTRIWKTSNNIRTEIVENKQKYAKLAGILALNTAIGSVTFGTGLLIGQGLGWCMGISSATPILGPAMGMATVASSSALTGQTTKRVKRFVDDGSFKSIKEKEFLKFSKEEMVIDAAIGTFTFKLFGGNFSNLMPSSLFNRGAYANESILTNGAENVTPAKKAYLQNIYSKTGCHHCGTKVGTVVADHIPAKRIVKDQILNWNNEQVLLPQCMDCARKQAIAVRELADKLVFHTNVVGRLSTMTGAFLGLTKTGTDTKKEV